jgi:hypothetical protein
MVQNPTGGIDPATRKLQTIDLQRLQKHSAIGELL